MARKKEFVRGAVLEIAMNVFWEHGFEATSTEMLTKAMGIGRQSLYDTFGDKRKLYLEALSLYSATLVSELVTQLQGPTSPLQALRRFLTLASTLPANRRRLGCMGINSVAEFGQGAQDVLQARAGSGSVLQLVLEKLVRDGIAAGEILDTLKPVSAVRYLSCVRTGLMMAARGGAPSEYLLDVAEVAISALGAQKGA